MKSARRIRVAGCVIALLAAGVSLCSAHAEVLSPALIYGVGVDNTIYYVDTTAQTIQTVAPSLSTGVKANGFATDRVRDQYRQSVAYSVEVVLDWLARG